MSVHFSYVALCTPFVERCVVNRLHMAAQVGAVIL